MREPARKVEWLQSWGARREQRQESCPPVVCRSLVACRTSLSCMLGSVLQALLLRPIKSQPLLSAACFGWTSAWLIDELVHRRSDAKADTFEPAREDEDVSAQDVSSGGAQMPPPPPRTAHAASAFLHALSDAKPHHATLQRQTMPPDSRGLRPSSAGRTGRACCVGPLASASVQSRMRRRRMRGACR